MLEPSVRSTQEKEGRYFSATLRLGCYSILTTEPTAHSLPFYKRVPRDKCLQITALAQATTKGGGAVSCPCGWQDTSLPGPW